MFGVTGVKSLLKNFTMHYTVLLENQVSKDLKIVKFKFKFYAGEQGKSSM
jgi:hypothetical protein